MVKRNASSKKRSSNAISGEPAEGDTLKALSRALRLVARATNSSSRPLFESEQANELQRRLSLLVNLLDIASPRQALNIREIADSWVDRFAEGQRVSLAELRRAIQPAAVASTREIAKSRQARDTIDLLESWNHALREDPEWKYIQTPVPGEPPAAIDDVFVDLVSVEGRNTSQDLFNYFQSEGLNEANLPNLTPLQIASRTTGQSIIVGPPGIGKSTLLRWLSRAIAKGESSEFRYAILVRLSEYAAARCVTRDLSITEYFLHQLNSQGLHLKQHVDEIRRQGAATRQILMLLDGWDEVQLTEREKVLKEIRREYPHYPVVITSRHSGGPSQLIGLLPTSFYHIAGLSHPAQNKLIDSVLRSTDQTHLQLAVSETIAREPSFGQLARNPFLLSLLVRILSRDDGRAGSPLTTTDIFDQLVSWIVRYTEHSNEQLIGLKRLAFELLFDRSESKYVFNWRELVERISVEDAGSLLKSRLIRQTSSQFDTYSFSHPTIQEYFAALHAQSLQADRLQSFFETAFYSSGKFNVLTYVAGMGGPTLQRFKAFVSQQLKCRDMNGVVLRRAMRVIVAGRWPERDWAPLRDELWEAVESSDAMECYEAIQLFVNVAAHELSDRIRRSTRLSERNRGFLLTWLPPSIVDDLKAALYPSVSWQSYVPPFCSTSQTDSGARDMLSSTHSRYRVQVMPIIRRHPLAEGELLRLRSTIADNTAPLDLRLRAIGIAGVIGDAGSVPVLVRLLRLPKLPEACTAVSIYSLVCIHSDEACEFLGELIASETGPSRKRSSLVVTAFDLLRHQALPAKTRFRNALLCQLALARPGDPSVLSILAALQPHMTRCAIDLVHEFACREDAGEDVRERAYQLLLGTADPVVLAALLKTGDSLASSVRSDLLDAAVDCGVPIPVSVVANEVSDLDSGRIKVSAWRLLKLASRYESREAMMALRAVRSVAAKMLSAWTDDKCDRCNALIHAIAHVPGRGRFDIDEELNSLALKWLHSFLVDPLNVQREPVGLSLAVLNLCGNAEHVGTLHNVAEIALRLRPTHEESKTCDVKQLVFDALARVAPQGLLRYLGQSDVAIRSLQLVAAANGWTAFRDRIVDADGLVIGESNQSCHTAGSENGSRSDDNRPAIKLGKDAKRAVRHLQYFYLIGLLFKKGKKSFREMVPVFETHPVLKGAGSTLTGRKASIEKFFHDNDHKDEKVFKGGAKGGITVVDLTEYGWQAWERTKEFLTSNGSLVDF